MLATSTWEHTITGERGFFDTEATIAALQARVNSLESQQQAQHLTIQSAFFQDPPVDSDPE